MRWRRLCRGCVLDRSRRRRGRRPGPSLFRNLEETRLSGNFHPFLSRKRGLQRERLPTAKMQMATMATHAAGVGDAPGEMFVIPRKTARYRVQSMHHVAPMRKSGRRPYRSVNRKEYMTTDATLTQPLIALKRSTCLELRQMVLMMFRAQYVIEFPPNMMKNG